VNAIRTLAAHLARLDALGLVRRQPEGDVDAWVVAA